MTLPLNMIDFPIVIVTKESTDDSLTGRLIHEVAELLRTEGFHATVLHNYADGASLVRAHSAVSAILISLEGHERRSVPIAAVTELLQVIHERYELPPVFLIGERKTLDEYKSLGQILSLIEGIIYLYEDTTLFIARRVTRAAREYLEGLLPPFFSALLEYAHEAPYSWHTPGHNGGAAYTKSPVGRMFHQFFGENLLRTDLSVSVPELGSLQDHTGPVRQAERHAAETFGADFTFFVTNGTSMANRVVYQGLVSRDDVVAVDRNCHKSVLQGVILTGAIPIYLQSVRNH